MSKLVSISIFTLVHIIMALIISMLFLISLDKVQLFIAILLGMNFFGLLCGFLISFIINFVVFGYLSKLIAFVLKILILSHWTAENTSDEYDSAIDYAAPFFVSLTSVHMLKTYIKSRFMSNRNILEDISSDNAILQIVFSLQNNSIINLLLKSFLSFADTCVIFYILNEFAEYKISICDFKQLMKTAKRGFSFYIFSAPKVIGLYLLCTLIFNVVYIVMIILSALFIFHHIVGFFGAIITIIFMIIPLTAIKNMIFDNIISLLILSALNDNVTDYINNAEKEQEEELEGDEQDEELPIDSIVEQYRNSDEDCINDELEYDEIDTDGELENQVTNTPTVEEITNTSEQQEDTSNSDFRNRNSINNTNNASNNVNNSNSITINSITNLQNLFDRGGADRAGSIIEDHAAQFAEFINNNRADNAGEDDGEN